MFKHYVGGLCWRKAVQLSKWLLRECNHGGQGSDEDLTETRTLMHPRPLETNDPNTQ